MVGLAFALGLLSVTVPSDPRIVMPVSIVDDPVEMRRGLKANGVSFDRLFIATVEDGEAARHALRPYLESVIARERDPNRKTELQGILRRHCGLRLALRRLHPARPAVAVLRFRPRHTHARARKILPRDRRRRHRGLSVRVSVASATDRPSGMERRGLTGRAGAPPPGGENLGSRRDPYSIVETGGCGRRSRR